MSKWRDRKSVKNAHERFTVELFLESFNRWHHSQFKIVEEPDPPDAVIRSGRTIRWVEVTAAFWNDAYAQDLCSYVTEDEQHKAISDGSIFVNPTAMFIKRFVSILTKKLEKKSYVSYQDKYGPGYLDVLIQYPWFGKDTMLRMRHAWANSPGNDLGCFRGVYLAHRVFGGEYNVSRWRL